MRLTCVEGNGASLAGRTSQSTARIACTIGVVLICRTFLRSVLFPLSNANGRVSTAPICTVRGSTA